VNRAEELALLFADGLASEAELRELETLVAADETARRACLRLLEVEVVLRAGGEADAVDATMERLRALLAEQTVGRVMEHVRFGTPEVPASSLGRPRWLALAAAVVVFLGLAGVWLSWPKKAVVSLADIQGDVRVTRGTRMLPAAAGFKLTAGDRLFTGTNAAAAVNFEGETTRIAVDSEADLTLVAARPAKQLRLLAGQALARVARQPEGHPLLFHTPHAVATVVGTEFRLLVATAQTRLDVQEGLVWFARAGAAGGVEVRAGEYAVAAPGKEPVTRALQREVLLVPSADESPRNRADWMERAGSPPMPGPFAAESPWNRPLGSGAAFTPVRAKSFPPAGPLNHIVKRLRLNLATATDPLRGIVVNGGRVGQSRVSDWAVLNAIGALPALFLDGASPSAFELLRVTRQPNGDLAAECGHRVDLQGSGFNVQGGGVSTFGVPFLGGLIRRGEFASGIRHALAASVPAGAFNFDGPGGKPFVWPIHPLLPAPPMRGGDTGNLQPGALLALPPSVDIARLGLSASGCELAHALQDYGVYLTQIGGEPFSLFAEDGGLPPAAELDAALNRLLPLLQMVTNNTPETSGGGGAPRRPPAPMIPSPRQP
jgi:hypothetical protein